MTTPLILTQDQALIDELARLAAAAGVVPEVVTDPAEALRAWSAAPVVLVGSDIADEVTHFGPPRRPSVHLVSWGEVPHEMFRTALTLGAESVAELPKSEGWAIELLSDLGEDSSGLLLGVMGGSGGAGASTFACGLGLVGGRRGPSMLVDADAYGARLTSLAGFEEVDGVGWDALQQTTGRISARSLREALPRRGGLGVLSWGPGSRGTLQAFAVREAIAAGQRGHDLVVVDLPRHPDPLIDEISARCDHLLLVVHASVPGVAAASQTVARLGLDRPMSLVLRGTGLDPRRVSETLCLPVTAAMPDQRGLSEALDLGAGPIRNYRGALAKAAAATLDVLGASDTLLPESA